MEVHSIPSVYHWNRLRVQTYRILVYFRAVHENNKTAEWLVKQELKPNKRHIKRVRLDWIGLDWITLQQLVVVLTLCVYVPLCIVCSVAFFLFLLLSFAQTFGCLCLCTGVPGLVSNTHKHTHNVIKRCDLCGNIVTYREIFAFEWTWIVDWTTHFESVMSMKKMEVYLHLVRIIMSA